MLKPLHCFVDDQDATTQLPAATQESCGPLDCPRGLFMSTDSNSCVACSPGSYPKTVSGSNVQCEVAKPGEAAVPVVSYLSGFQTSSSLLPGWETGCSGLCGVRGWRMRSHFMDSGFHGDEEVDVWARLSKVFAADGSIEFLYSVDSVADGLDFFIDGVRQSVFRPAGGRRAQERVLFPVSKGAHAFEWIYHQSDGSEGSVLVEQVTLLGVAGGGTEKVLCPAGTFSGSNLQSACDPCPPGTYSSAPGSSKCDLCKAGEFQPRPGQSACHLCPAGASTTQPGSLFCSMPCKYQSPTNSKLSWDLSAIGSLHLGPIRAPSSRLTSQYHMQFCTPIQDVKICNNTKGEALVTYVCEVDDKTHTGVSAGEVIQFGVTSDNKLEMTFSGGSDEGCEGGDTRTTRVIFSCDPDVSGVSQVLLVYAEGACSRTFSVSALQGCLACDANFDTTFAHVNSDYSNVQSECLDGSRTFTFLRKNRCNGPAVHTVTVSCESELQVPYYSIAVVAGLLVALLIGVGFLIFRNRRISQSYSQLLEQREGNAMGGLGGQGSTSMIDNSLDLEHGLDSGIETL